MNELQRGPFLADIIYVRARKAVLWFGGSGLLMGLGMLGLSALAPGKGVELSPRLSWLLDLSALLGVVGFLGLLALLFWIVCWGLMTTLLALLTRLKARSVARAGQEERGVSWQN